MMSASDCPFCGHNSISSFSSYQDLLDNGTRQFPEIATPDGPIQISSNPRPRDFHKCCSCRMEYSYTTIDVEELITGSRGERHIAILLQHHYPDGPSIQELIRRYRTATLKKPRHVQSYVADDEANRMIIIPFNYQGTRAYATFMKDIGSNTYEITNLVRMNV